MSDFAERSGAVNCPAPWGHWSQTMEEVLVEVEVAVGTRSKDIRCEIKPRELEVTVHQRPVIKGELYGWVLPDESVWTLEDRKLLHILLVKSDCTAANCWRSLLRGEAEQTMLVDQMAKKLTLERFQKENPGFDFSGAEISGNYADGGPKF